MNYNYSNRVSSLKGSVIREILKFTGVPGMISFAAGNPAPEAFPVKDVQRLSAEILENHPIDALQYSITEGYTPLRDHLKKYMEEKYNIGTENDDVIITAGAQQVMDLATKSLVNEGDTVICEAPSFIGSLNCFRSFGAHLAGVPTESDGMNVEKLEEALNKNPNAKFIYTIPNFQNPAGVTMSFEKRKKVYELAKKYGVLIIEDNPYGDIRFAGEDVPAIKTLDTDGIVIYAGTFSKVISPGMRVGFTVAPKGILSKMIVCKQTEDVHSNIWAQMLCLDLMTKTDYEKHLADNRLVYKKKAELMMNLLDKHLVPHGVTYDKVEGGLFIWCKLPDGVPMIDFCKSAVEKKVACVPGNAFLTSEDEPCSSIRLNFSTPTDEDIVKGMAILEEVLKDYLK